MPLGVLADCLLPQQNAMTLSRVYAPKVHGASRLDGACVALSLTLDVLFSSVTALLGAAAQANYSAANSCLDAQSSQRRAAALVSVSVQWGAWADVGMAARGAASKRMKAAETASGPKAPSIPLESCVRDARATASMGSTDTYFKVWGIGYRV